MPALLQRALEHHQRGQLPQAEALYRQLLQAQPRHADALHLLGVIALQQGRFEAAVDLIQQALAVRPADNFHCNLGNALKALGRRAEAIGSYRQALALNPRLADAWCNLGNALLEEGQAQEAEAACRQALALRPAFAEAHCNLGNALLKQDRVDEAIDCYQRALQAQPGLAVVYANLGDALDRRGLPGPALECYHHALSIGPDTAELHAKAGRLLRRQGQLAPAIDALVRALQRHDREDFRVEFVQTVKNAHFQAPHPEVRALLLRALEEGWADPAELLTPATSLVECEPAVQQALARPNASALPALAADRLLLRLLVSDALNSIALERLLSAARRQLLAQALDEQAAPATPAALDFHAALARQCFINEYVYACSEEEQQQRDRLQARLDTSLPDSSAPPLQLLLAHASYAPLSVLAHAERWAALPWPAPVAALFSQQVGEPALERRLRDTLPRLTAITDTVSQQVRAQYEAHPYPRWVHAPRAAAPVALHQLLQHQFPHRRWPLAPQPGRPLDVLVAGCGTGQHAVRVAQQFSDARVLAIDLSLASLAYAQRKTRELGLTQIDYAQADLLQLGTLAQRFDLIESAGVLHHLADPLAGWRVLQSLLRPGGLMFLGLYSELGRRDVVAARERLAASGLPSDAAAIRHCRQILMSDAQAPQFAQFLASRDFYATSACRDLLFHVQEHRFTLPRLKQALAELDLEFIGFELDAEVRAAYARQFPGDAAQTDLDHWHAFEQARPSTFSRMYQFWVRRRD
jgi:tetratricopeptide (TPR) repeat protein